MRESIPSRTALRVALRRDSPKVLDDPLAIRILGDAAANIQSDAGSHQTAMARRFRAFMVARSRYAED
jgi:O-methyltransferase involved in polyketide biosynthesis